MSEIEELVGSSIHFISDFKKDLKSRGLVPKKLPY